MVISQSKAIRKKLMAATAMLLIACIMLISASYAWFTLSTAPEVTGITTTVGANGNLEMALADPTTWDDPDAMGTSTGVSLDLNSGHAANKTWGNLVDLSLDEYGLDSVILNPSVLNLTEAGLLHESSYLKTPVYGTDGRVEALQSNTLFGKYDVQKGGFLQDDDHVGVRALGNASAMTDRQLAYRNALAAINSASDAAARAAASSLSKNGSALAQIIVDKAMTDAPKYTPDQLALIAEVIASLQTSAASVREALDSAMLAYAASAAVQDGDSALKDAATFTLFLGIFNSSTKTVTDSGMTVGEYTIPLPSGVKAYYDKLAAVDADLTAAAAALNTSIAANKTEYEWADISAAVSALVDQNLVTVNGMGVDEVSSNISGFVSQFMSDGAVKVQMGAGSGVYAELAEFCGNYSASFEVTVNAGTYGTIDAPTSMETTIAAASLLSAAYTVANAAGAPASATADDAEVFLTDTFGYAIDLYFRTNANNSNLLLQTEGAQRIYEDSSNEETLGGGSSMTFASLDASFTSDNVKSLMESIRVAFVAEDGEIIGYAKLDMSTASVVGSEVTAKLYLYEFEIANGAISFKKTAPTEGAEAVETKVEDGVLCALTKNTAQKLTAVVYLDGNTVTNADVANAQMSMTGTMNLQFASDAELTPMQNATLNPDLGDDSQDAGAEG